MKCIIRKFGLLVLFCFLGLHLYSQNKYHILVNYQYQWQPDSTVQNKKMESMVLLVNDESSCYLSEKALKLDSVINTLNKYDSPMNLMAAMMPYKSEVKYKVFKNYTTTSYILDHIGSMVYHQYTYPKMEWKILADTAIIQNMLCQKAICKSVGRTWEAWFTTTIPINDGPDRFSGLPGLIVKLNDSQHYFSWVIIGIEEKNNSIGAAQFNVVKCSREDALKLKAKYRANPSLKLLSFSKSPNAKISKIPNAKPRPIENNFIDHD